MSAPLRRLALYDEPMKQQTDSSALRRILISSERCRSIYVSALRRSDVEAFTFRRYDVAISEVNRRHGVSAADRTPKRRFLKNFQRVF